MMTEGEVKSIEKAGKEKWKNIFVEGDSNLKDEVREEENIKRNDRY